MNKLAILVKGLIKENPIFVLVLGMCPSIAVTTSVANAVGMGITTTFVLVFSNALISLLKNVIPDKVRIPAYIVIIASSTSMIDLLLQGFVPSLAANLGIFIPLIAVNCIVLGRAEAFANKNTVVDSMLDGVGMGLGFTGAITIIGAFREMLGNGSFLGYSFMEGNSMLVFILAPGGFIVLGLLMALVNVIQKKKN